MGPRRRALAAASAAAAIDAGAPSTSFCVVPGWCLDVECVAGALPRARGRRGRRAAPLATLSGALGSVPGRLAALVPRPRPAGSPTNAKGGRASPPTPPPHDTPSHHARHLLAGAASCAVTRTALAPLERVKLEQVLRRRAGAGFRATVVSVWRGGGAAGFWAGNGVNLLRTCPPKRSTFLRLIATKGASLRRPGRLISGRGSVSPPAPSPA